MKRGRKPAAPGEPMTATEVKIRGDIYWSLAQHSHNQNMAKILAPLVDATLNLIQRTLQGRDIPPDSVILSTHLDPDGNPVATYIPAKK